MRIFFFIGEPIICGGILVPCQYVEELKKQGYEAYVVADRHNPELEAYAGKFKLTGDVTTTKDDVIVAVRWEQCEMLSAMEGMKIQLVQGRDLDADCGDDWKQEMSKWRNNPNWELIGVSQFCLNDWNRGVVIPNGVHDRFFKPLNIPKDIDILIEGNNETNKNITEALHIARSLDCKVAWLGREVDRTTGCQLYFENPPQDEIPSIYQRSKVMLKLSKSEGFSLPILEAMASGCAVITREMGGNDFCIYGWNAARPDDLKKVLQDDGYRNFLILNGEQTASQYTWEYSVNKLIEYLKQNGKRIYSQQENL